MSSYAVDFFKIIEKEEELNGLLKVVRHFELPDWYLAAGVVRNSVWDSLCGYEDRKINDVDLIYFDEDLSEDKEKLVEEMFDGLGGYHWDVKNSARVHLWDERYDQVNSPEEHVAYWSETPTCVGVRLEENGMYNVIAPHGLDDLMNLVVRPVPEKYKAKALYKKRMAKKNWLERWPQLNISFL